MPAPFVVLAQQLPMAILYDPKTLDPSGAAVADRLRKQAKTRAVKVVRDTFMYIMYICICLSIYLSIDRSIYLSIYLYVCM